MAESVTIYTPSGPLEFTVGKDGVSKIIPRRDGKSVWMMINGSETIFNSVTFSVKQNRLPSGISIEIRKRN